MIHRSRTRIYRSRDSEASCGAWPPFSEVKIAGHDLVSQSTALSASMPSMPTTAHATANQRKGGRALPAVAVAELCVGVEFGVV